MCFGGGSQPKAPDPVKPLPPPVAPLAPVNKQPVLHAPQTLKIEKQEGVVRRKSSKELTGQTSQGTAQLRVPVNIGTNKSGGLNI